MNESNHKQHTNIRKRFLLVMPQLVQQVGDGYSFPLGIAYISGSLKAAGFDVYTLNLNHRGGDVTENIQKEIREKRIDVVATGGLSFQYNSIRTVVMAAKDVDARIITIVGGGIITSDPEPAMDALEFVDYGVVGEGELTAVELCHYLEDGGDASKINGVIYKNGAGYHTTPSRTEIQDLNALPWPDYDGFELEQYLNFTPAISGINRTNTVFMIASRSCPYNCTFCFHTTGQKYRQRTMDSFFEELDYMVSRYKIDYLCLADELFSTNSHRVRSFCERIKKYGIRWWAQFRVDKISPELLGMLKESGCDVMSFGLESADDNVLKSMQKFTTRADMERTLKMVYEAGISFEGAFIFGDINETWETANNTLTWWRNHAHYKITLNLITIFPGTPLYHDAYRRGILKDKVKFLREGCPQINVSKLSDDEFAGLVRIIMESPITFLKTLDDIRIDEVDYITGRVNITGTCTACQHRGDWPKIKLMAATFVSCPECGQRYNVVLPNVLRQNVEANIEKLLKRYGKLAVWGINYHTASLIKNSKALLGSGVFPIDISSTKRMMDLYGKKISAPEVLREKKIEALIILIPVYFSEIAGHVRSTYPEVKQIVDVCSLLNPAFE
ncbi:MAG: cobalamin-dependent protein [Magnetococcales bacterium]|nr:cobalamin-dependent protein [Magnetococcales bacterium]MBF0321899.1 cobalamin-dependent protein [Magnetococcales bacterium]